MKEKNEVYCYGNNQKFIITKKIKDYIYIDEKSEVFCIPKISIWSGKLKPLKSKFYSFNQISNVELQVDGKIVSSVTRGGLGSAIAGGILLGDVGAMLGAVTGKRITKYDNKSVFYIVIQLNDISDPCIQIALYDRKIANEIISIMKIILEQKKYINENTNANVDVPLINGKIEEIDVDEMNNVKKQGIDKNKIKNAQNNIENMMIEFKKIISKILNKTWKGFRWFLSVAAVFLGISGDIFSLVFGFSLLPLTYKLILKYFPQINENIIKKVEIILPIIVLILIGIFYE